MDAVQAGTGSTQMAGDASQLSERDARILDFERQWWKYAGAKEQAVRELFDMSATRYYQVLNALIDSPGGAGPRPDAGQAAAPDAGVPPACPLRAKAGCAGLGKGAVSDPAEYGTDEFDVDPEPGARRGAHRATLSPLLTWLPWVLGAAVSVAVILAVLSVVGGGDTPLTGTAATPSETAPASEPAASEPAPTTPAPTESAAPTTSAPPATTAPPEPDRSVELVVLNGTRTSGLATRAAKELADDGWTVSKTDNYRAAQPPTTVYFASEDLAVTAAAVADVLGGVAQLDAGIADTITVVLGNDYS